MVICSGWRTTLGNIYHHLEEGTLLPISQDDKVNVGLKGIIGEGEYVFHSLVPHHLLYRANGRNAWTRVINTDSLTRKFQKI